METLKIEKQDVKMIAHRGLSGLEAENTIEAFVAAANRSYYGIECDIHLTKDNQFVVIHDDNTKRVSPHNLKISEKTYDELQAVDLYDYLYQTPKGFRKIPLLGEYLEICKKYEKISIIEIKPRFTEQQMLQLIEIVNAYDYLDYSIFISFDLENLILLRKLNKELALQYLVNEYDISVLNSCRKHNLDVNISYHNLSLEIVQTFHKYNIRVNVFTVDNPIVALMLVTWKVNFITTNILE